VAISCLTLSGGERRPRIGSVLASVPGLDPADEEGVGLDESSVARRGTDVGRLMSPASSRRPLMGNHSV